MALALFIGTDVALLSAFIAATAALGLILGRALKAVRDAHETRKVHHHSKTRLVAQGVPGNPFTTGS